MMRNYDLKWHLEDLNKANSAISVIGRVIEEIQNAEYDEECHCPFKGNGYVKDCLTKGIDALSTFIGLKLEIMAEMAGVEKPV